MRNAPNGALIGLRTATDADGILLRWSLKLWSKNARAISAFKPNGKSNPNLSTITHETLSQNPSDVR